MKYKLSLASIVFILCVHVSCLSAMAATRIPLSMHNYTSGDVSLAVRYYDVDEATWITFGWLTVPAYTSIHKKLPTDVSHLYFYAVNTNGKVYEGAEHRSADKKFMVSDASFVIGDGEKPLDGALSMRYFRHKKARKGSFEFKF